MSDAARATMIIARSATMMASGPLQTTSVAGPWWDAAVSRSRSQRLHSNEVALVRPNAIGMGAR